jgi:hypothetical protein
MRTFVLLFCCSIFIACSNPKTEKRKESASEPLEKPKKQRPISLDNGKFFKVNNTAMLYGGKDSLQHFNVSNLTLEPSQFHYGIGREAFPALLQPTFFSITEAVTLWADSTRFLVGSINGEAKAYSVPDLTHHEIVNDVLGGEPVIAAYCILADLGAIYTRTYNDQVFTFALSGYTYYDSTVWNGLDGFVWWDRETESLWWPLIDKAVSGPMLGVGLQELSKENWEDISWKEVKQKYPDAKVMQSGLDYERPTTWKKLDDVSEIVKAYSMP